MIRKPLTKDNFDVPRFLIECRNVIDSYLESDDIEPKLYLKKIGELYDTVPDDREEYKDMALEVGDYIKSIYNAWKDDVKFNFEGRIFDGVEDRKKRREREIQIMRFTKSLFRKGMECGISFPC